MNQSHVDVVQWARSVGGKPAQANQRLGLKVKTGTVIVGSDAHYWPGVITPAHRALVQFIRDMGPEAVVMNGDIIDGASNSRHPAMDWEKRPTLRGELDAAHDRLEEIIKVSPGVPHFWIAGNHDKRFNAKLANVAAEYADIRGMSLRDHFPEWSSCESLWINDDVVVKHSCGGGVHATHNNTVKSGKTIVTGHLHSLKVTPFTDLNGTRYGVDTGTLGKTYGEHTSYMGDNTRNWRSGFAVLTFVDGELLWPELVSVRSETTVQFRGKIVKV